MQPWASLRSPRVIRQRAELACEQPLQLVPATTCGSRKGSVQSMQPHSDILPLRRRSKNPADDLVSGADERLTAPGPWTPGFDVSFYDRGLRLRFFHAGFDSALASRPVLRSHGRGDDRAARGNGNGICVVDQILGHRRAGECSRGVLRSVHRRAEWEGVGTIFRPS